MKAVLVIDIPDGIFVEDCVINYEVQESVMQKNVSAGVERLRPLPQREKANEGSYGLTGVADTAWTQGFNDCLSEITGETE